MRVRYLQILFYFILFYFIFWCKTFKRWVDVRTEWVVFCGKCCRFCFASCSFLLSCWSWLVIDFPYIYTWLEEIGLIGKILDIIKSMYKFLKVSLIHQDKISQTFLTTIGLKQGDVLSTILLNIYINDLPRPLLGNSRSPDTIKDTPYLDDSKIYN